MRVLSILVVTIFFLMALNTAGAEKLPFCSERAEKDGWSLFAQPNYFSLKPEIYDLVDASKVSSIQFSGNANKEGLSFNFNHSIGINSDYDFHQIWVNGQKIYEGQWKIVRSEKSRRETPPYLTPEDVANLSNIAEAEFRVVKRYGSTGKEKFDASAKVDMTQFSKMLKTAKEAMAISTEKKKNRECRSF